MTRIFSSAVIELTDNGVEKFKELGIKGSEEMIAESLKDELSGLLEDSEESSLTVEIEVLDE